MAKLESCLGIMEEPHFIKSEPEWLPDNKELLKGQSEDCFLSDNATSVKAEAGYSSDAELNANEEKRNSFCENETQILKEEIIKEEEEDINRRTEDFDVPASSSSSDVIEEDADGLKYENEPTNSHKRKGTHKCKKCNTLFTCRQDLWEHNKTDCGEKAYQCSVCNKSFRRVAHLRRHTVLHTGTRMYQCPTCPRTFSDTSNLRGHLKVHTEERPFICSTCSMAFRTKGNLKRHMILHTRRRPIHCSKCGKVFIDSANLKRHFKVHSVVT